MARALVAVSLHQEDWWNISANKAVEIMMKSSGGTISPVHARTSFCRMVQEAGLDAIE